MTELPRPPSLNRFMRSKMRWIQNRAGFCVLLILQVQFVCGEIRFLQRSVGESADFSCRIPPRSSPVKGFFLNRSWLRPGQVLFKYADTDFTASGDRSRFSVHGDPQGHEVNVSLSRLGPGDTDRYVCEFVEEKPSSADERIKAATEFFLLVETAPLVLSPAPSGDAPGPLDMDLVQTCAGGSVTIPCVAPAETSASVEGVILKRKRGRAPVEVAYHSQRHQGAGHAPSPPQFQLSSVPGPGGISYNLTLQQLQPEDSGLYGCQLLQQDGPDGGAGLGRRLFFVSVQGGQRGCSGESSYPTLLYVLSSAVAALLLLLLLLGLVLLRKSKRRSSRSPAPIYEEMVGVQTRKMPLHMAGGEYSEYKNYKVQKSCPPNHYESPSGTLAPRSEAQI